MRKAQPSYAPTAIGCAGLGPPKEQLSTLEVEHSTTTYLITATVLMVLGAGLIWFANIFPALQ